MFVKMMRANKAGVCLIFPLVALEQHIQWKIALNWIILPDDSEDVWWPKTMLMTGQYLPHVPIPRTGSHYHDQWQVTSAPPLSTIPGATRTPLLNVTTEKL